VELVNCMAWELAAVFDRTGKQVARVRARFHMYMYLIFIASPRCLD
jgi:hypothetical protein